MKSSVRLLPVIFHYKLSRSVDLKPPFPVNITVSVTNACNSRCKTCFIWKLYRDHPELKNEEFETWEFERTFESIWKRPVWVTLSGGEPFLRRDIVEICNALSEHCSPQIVTIPTNGLLPTLIEDATKKILEECNHLKLILNLSLDGVGKNHDEIRGIVGNFNRLVDTFQRLKRLKEEFSNLSIGIHSVISRYNIDNTLQVYEFVRLLDPDSYITEVAEERTELFNINSGITPNADAYAKFIKAISERVKKDYKKSKGFLSKVTQAFRIVYYQTVAQELRNLRQIVPCYAGYASCQITPYGDVWPCCVLGYEKSMGDLREVNYDFKKIWYSMNANKIRRQIKAGNCACPLANAYYTNVLCNFGEMLKVFRAMI